MMTINDDFNRNKIVKMVNLSSNLNQNYISTTNKSKIPVKMYQTYTNIAPQFKYQKKISSNFKSNSSFNLTKIPKLIKMKNNEDNQKTLDASTLSTNTFNVASTEKLLKNRKVSADRKNFKRSQSFNTDTNNVSSLSNKSNITSSNTSIHSFSSSKIINRNSEDLIKFIKRKLKEIEKSPSIDELAEFLNEEIKSNAYKRINLHTLETFRLRNISKSLPNSQLSSHTNKITSKLSKQSNTPNLENDSRLMNKNAKIIESYFSSLKMLDQLFKSAHKELFQKALQIEQEGLNGEKTFNIKTRKYQRKLQELIEKFNIIINDKDGSDISLLSPESYIFSKQEYYKYGEYVLRLLTDLVFKFKIALKLYTKIVELNGSKPNIQETQKHAEKLPKILNGKKNENHTLESTSYISNKNVKTKQFDAHAFQNSMENLNESFIKETDCSSIVSEDDVKDRESKRSSYSSNSKTKENTNNNNNTNNGNKNSNNNNNNNNNPIEDYKQLKKKIFFLNEDLSDLNMYLDSLNLRAERCSKLEEQLKSDRELIKKAELNLKLCDKSDDTLKHHLEKQLEYLKYRFKINLQDFNIEKICAPEIYTAISDTEFKIFKLNSYLQDLNMNLVYTESKLNMNKTKYETKVIGNFKSNYPRQLPPIQQYHTREFSLQQFE